MINHRQMLQTLRVVSYFGNESYRWLNKFSYTTSLQTKLSDIVNHDSEMLNCNNDFFSSFGIQPKQVQDYAVDVQEKDEATFDLLVTSATGNADEREQLKALIGADFLYNDDLKWVKLSDNYNQYLKIYNATRYSIGLPHIIDNETGIYGHIEFVNNYTETTTFRDDVNDGYTTDTINSSGGGSLNFLGTLISHFGDARNGPISEKRSQWNSHLGEAYEAFTRTNAVTFTIIITDVKKRSIEGVKICVHNNFRATDIVGEVTRYDYENKLVIDGDTYILPLEIANTGIATGQDQNIFERHTTSFRSVVTGKELPTYQSVVDLLD